MKRQHAGAAALFLVLSILMTWPLALDLRRAVAYPGDPYITIWVLDWDHYAITHWLPLFDANAFHPARYSLAFSENLFGIAVLLIPFRLAGVDAISAHNLAMLGGFAFSGFGAYLLARKLTGSFVAGLTAGVFYAFVPFRFTQVSHVQHVWGGWIPILLLTLLNSIDAPSRQRAMAFGAAFVMNGLTNIHWFLFGSFAVAATALLFRVAGVRRWRELLIATACAMVVLAPFLYPYWAVAKLYGMTRTWAELKMFSATLSDWLVVTDQNRLYSRLADPTVNPERWLFPGALSIVLAVVAVAALRRYPRAVVVGLLWVGIGVLGSLGVSSFFHRFLYDAVPGFQAVRVPARWAAIAYLGLAILVAVATTLFERRRTWVAALVPLAFVIELRAAPMRWYDTIPEPPQVYTWLARQPLNGAVVELPLDVAESEYSYLLRSTAHHKRLINGVSGFAPRPLLNLIQMFKSTPISDAFTDELRRSGCELVIIHLDNLGPHDAQTRQWIGREIDRGRMHFVGRFQGGINGDWVFGFGRAPTRPALLEAFLAGRRTYNQETFGIMDPPEPVVRHVGWFSGYALSPYGVRGVDLLFNNGGVRIPATLIEDKNVTAAFPWYPQCPLPRFIASMPEKPKGIRRRTDVQAEIIDGRGRRTRLTDHWITWLIAESEIQNPKSKIQNPEDK